MLQKNSYVIRKVAENLHLDRKRKILKSHCLFGGRETSIQMHNVYDLIISDMDDFCSWKAGVFSENKVTCSVPKLCSVEALIELREKLYLILNARILKLIYSLGVYLVATLFTIKCMKLDSGLLLIEIHLGCLLTGNLTKV